MDDCRKCKSWRDCRHDLSYFYYSEIRWCAQQVFWLLKFADICHTGEWPVPDATVVGGMRGQAVTEAAFVKVALAIGEVDIRLERTGWRGRLLAEECRNREKMLYLSNDAKDALYYVAGWRRKDRSFSDWNKDRRYYRKSDTNVVKTGRS